MTRFMIPTSLPPDAASRILVYQYRAVERRRPDKHGNACTFQTRPFGLGAEACRACPLVCAVEYSRGIRGVEPRRRDMWMKWQVAESPSRSSRTIPM